MAQVKSSAERLDDQVTSAAAGAVGGGILGAIPGGLIGAVASIVDPLTWGSALLGAGVGLAGALIGVQSWVAGYSYGSAFLGTIGVGAATGAGISVIGHTLAGMGIGGAIGGGLFGVKGAISAAAEDAKQDQAYARQVARAKAAQQDVATEARVGAIEELGPKYYLQGQAEGREMGRQEGAAMVMQQVQEHMQQQAQAMEKMAEKQRAAAEAEIAKAKAEAAEARQQAQKPVAMEMPAFKPEFSKPEKVEPLEIVSKPEPAALNLPEEKKEKEGKSLDALLASLEAEAPKKDEKPGFHAGKLGEHHKKKHTSHTAALESKKAASTPNELGL